MKKSVLDLVLSENLIEHHDLIIVALSGGADSMALLHWLLSMRNSWHLTVHCIHIHHGIRLASDQEAIFVQEYCEENNVPLHMERIDLKHSGFHGLSLEEAARKARYAIFDGYINRMGGKIALGHHMDDQAETVLMNMLRGAGTQGLKGMLPRRNAYIRPLLSTTKEEILLYCKTLDIPYVEDESNTDTAFRRNLLRHEIMPLIAAKVQPKLNQKLYNASVILREEDAYLSQVTIECGEKVLKKGLEVVTIQNQKLVDLPEVLKRRVLRLAVGYCIPELRDVGFEHIEQMKELIESEKTGKLIRLPHGWQLRTDYGESHIEKKRAFTLPTVEHKVIDLEKLEESGEVTIDGFRLRLLSGVSACDYPRNVYTKWMDYDKIGTNLVLRTRLPGDWIRLGVEAHRKKLKDYLIDVKISIPKTATSL